MSSRDKRKIKKFLLNCLLILLVYFIFYIFDLDIDKSENVNFSDNLEVYFFDVGQADSSLIIVNDKVMMVDCGNNDDGKSLVNKLNLLGIKKIDYLIGTHPHEDHIGGMDDIINNFSIDTIYMPDVISTTSYYKDVLEAALNNNLKISTPEIGSNFKLNDLDVEVLYLDTDSTNLNDDSIVLKLIYGNNKLLFMGDVSKSVEDKIMYDDISADVIKIGHHGSSESSSVKFLKSVGGDYAIISVGKDNRYGHPTNIVLKNLEKYNYKVLRTDYLGDIKLISDGNKISIGE